MGFRLGSARTIVITTVVVSALTLTTAGVAAAPARPAARAHPTCTSAKRHRFAVWLSGGIDRALAGRV